MTPVLGETEDGGKTTRCDASIAPRTVVYDPELTRRRCHGGLTLTSSLNALAHAVDGLWARTRRPRSTHWRPSRSTASSPRCRGCSTTRRRRPAGQWPPEESTVPARAGHRTSAFSAAEPARHAGGRRQR
ncbi:hypothetical protein [Streptomyces sp. NBC_01618]|uniref:hypothetical protein n=1 Tax=Streptomyces sp. NBC_01618 TaxID=2975900 RepID=UPI00386FEFEB